MKKITILSLLIMFSVATFAQKSTGLVYQAPKAKKEVVDHSKANFFDGFENGFAANGWTVLNEDGDANAWVVSAAAPTYGIETHTGDSLALVVYNSAGCDDYLISPQISIAEGDELSFYAASTGSWLETFEVLVSTTGTNVADFTINLETVVDAASEYTKYSYILTDDAGINDGDNVYIAIRCTSVDKNALRLDDFAVAPVATTSDIEVTATLASPYTIIPDFFTTEFEFQSTIANTGADVAAGQVVNVTEVDGTYAGTGTTSAVIADASSETVDITPVFAPAAVGAYEMAFQSDLAGDTDLTNNADTIYVAVSDTVFARDFGPDGGSMGIGDGAVGILGQLFEIESTCALTSVTFQLVNPTAETTVVKLYAFDGTTVTGSELATSATVNVDTAAAAAFSMYTAEINATLNAGTYFIGIEEPSTGNITLATSGVADELAEAWVYYNNAWAAAVDFGFYQTYVLRANIDNTVDVANVTESNVSVYPNPANDVVVIENAENATVTIINMVGQVVASQNVNSNRESVNISDLSEGTYVIRIENGTEVQTQKLNVIR